MSGKYVIYSTGKETLIQWNKIVSVKHIEGKKNIIGGENIGRTI
jgi:hypothetical protein